MTNEHNNLREFGKCRLDIEKKVLWCEEKPVQLPLKAIELLCVLVEKGGEVATKDEIWRDVWQDAFVEETNLTHNIYLLRKALKHLGEKNLIQTVPRRGYRFTGKMHKASDGELVIEKYTKTRTLIEFQDNKKVAPKAPSANRVLSKDFISGKFRTAVICAFFLALMIGAAAFSVYQNKLAGPSAAGIKTIAVLPFKTINAGEENQHQGWGLTDILITRLGNIRQISVRPTEAALNLKDHDAVSIGHKLQADAVLEGTIYRIGDKVRITTRLIRVSDGSAIWNGQFEKLETDELQMQNEIALQVTEALTLTLTSNEKDILSKSYTKNPDAFELYHRGRYAWNKRSWAGMLEAERLFRNAIEKDPEFALAYVGLADSMMMNGSAQAQETGDAILKALELDPDLAEAHATYGFIRSFHNWDWKGAEISLKKAIELNPNYASAHHWYAQVLTIQGKHEEAKAEMRRALEINPLSYNFLADLGQIYYFNREYETAETYCRQALEIYPDFSFAHQYLYDIYMKTGRYDLAIEEFITASKIMGTFDNQSAERRKETERHFARMRKDFAEGSIAKFAGHFSIISEDPNLSYFNSKFFAMTGEKEKALDRLGHSFSGRGFSIPFAKVEPIFDNLRDEPQYREILQKMNLE